MLYAGAIELAGAVGGHKARRHATSDWMELEQERGISIMSAALEFELQGRRMSLLDTPGIRRGGMRAFEHDFLQQRDRLLVHRHPFVQRLEENGSALDFFLVWGPASWNDGAGAVCIRPPNCTTPFQKG